jgi:hypothetical protein
VTATNHALTGTIIGLAITVPIVAIPLAFASHYVLDALPHFGSGKSQRQTLRSAWFRYYLILEAFICFSIVMLLAVIQPFNWFLAAVCAFAAAAPDLFSINRYVSVTQGREYKPNMYSRFASKIQWFEKPIGGLVELAYLLIAVTVLVKLL